MRLFIDTNIIVGFQFQTAAQNRCGTLITTNIDDYKNADQSRLEILTPSAFVEKYINAEP